MRYLSTDNVMGSVTENGFLDYGNNTDIGGRVEGRLWALYVADEWKLTDRTRLDAGLRHQRPRHRGYTLGRTTQNQGNPQTLADDEVGGPSGTIENRSERLKGTAWMIGVDHDFQSIQCLCTLYIPLPIGSKSSLPCAGIMKPGCDAKWPPAPCRA